MCGSPTETRCRERRPPPGRMAAKVLAAIPRPITTITRRSEGRKSTSGLRRLARARGTAQFFDGELAGVLVSVEGPQDRQLIAIVNRDHNLGGKFKTGH